MKNYFAFTPQRGSKIETCFLVRFFGTYVLLPKTQQFIFLFDTVRIWEFSPVWTDFDKFDNLSKRNVKLILKIFSDLEPVRGSSNKKTLYSARSCVVWAFFGIRGPFKLAHSCRKKPKLHTNSLNKLHTIFKTVRVRMTLSIRSEDKWLIDKII
jgi:hypothetical protein